MMDATQRDQWKIVGIVLVGQMHLEMFAKISEVME